MGAVSRGQGCHGWHAGLDVNQDIVGFEVTVDVAPSVDVPLEHKSTSSTARGEGESVTTRGDCGTTGRVSGRVRERGHQP
jgi:hypothetical protein